MNSAVALVCTSTKHTGIRSLFVAVLGLLAATSATAQGRSDMPLFLVEGNQYARRSFDEQGRLTQRQQLEISRVRAAGDDMEVVVTLWSYDEAGQPTNTVRTTIRCKTQDAGMVMNVMALIRPEGRRVEVRLTGGEVRYPRAPTGPGTLPPVTLEANVEQGVLGFLGGKSRIRLRDRTIQAAAGPSSAYTITEWLDLKFYVLGVKVRERSYHAEQAIDPEQGLVQQTLTAPDGSYVSIERTG